MVGLDRVGARAVDLPHGVREPGLRRRGRLGRERHVRREKVRVVDARAAEDVEVVAREPQAGGLRVAGFWVSIGSIVISAIVGIITIIAAVVLFGEMSSYSY